jgi:uncharacterized protein (DUF1800 family)
VPPGGVWVNAPYGDGTINSRRITSFKSWWTGQMLTQQVSLREKMVLFWHNHFSTQTATVSDSRYIYKHNNLLRTMAFGNFKELVKQITIDPAMLRYLNGYASSKTAPDENYARELQELFTMGKGPNSKYTESDVKAAARLLANLAAFLMSDFSGYINGEVITIDGGEWLQGAGQMNGLEAIPTEMWDMLEQMTRSAKGS